MEVVSAELHCVHSMMEYIKMKLYNTTGALQSSRDAGRYLLANDGWVLPHDAGEHELHNKRQVGPSVERQSLDANTRRGSESWFWLREAKL